MSISLQNARQVVWDVKSVAIQAGWVPANVSLYFVYVQRISA